MINGMDRPKGFVGELRRSQVVTSFGPGSVVDFSAPGGHPVSGMVGGLESWDEAAPDGAEGVGHGQVIRELRLLRKYDRKAFRLPPVRPEAAPDIDDDVLPVFRFPTWLQCPKCNNIRPADVGAWRRDNYNRNSPARFCFRCTDGQDNPVAVVPVRFLVACQNGHVDDFPWQEWIGCDCGKPKLELKSVGAGLSGLLLNCYNNDCSSERPKSLGAIFNKDRLREVYGDCRCKRPWLGDRDPQSCDERPQVLQRGGSTVYFAALDSALSIPPFSIGQGLLDQAAVEVVDGGIERDQWSTYINMRSLPESTGRSADAILNYFEVVDKELSGDGAEDLQAGEYWKFDRALDEEISQGDFEVSPVSCPPELQSVIGGVARASRLREVRVLHGFTRVNPPGGIFRNTGTVAPLSAERKDWLPAVEIFGEGIFIKLNRKRLENWREREAVKGRFETLRGRAFDAARNEQERETIGKLTPTFVLLHSFAHLLMRQLSFDCGYSSSALVERIYSDVTGEDIAGILIHTGSPDSDGTLGGLERQAEPGRFIDTVTAALFSSQWCSSDPMCINDTQAISTPQNLAACHACLLAPETSCRFFNSYLDRGFLIGTPEEPEIGFFTETAQMLEKLD